MARVIAVTGASGLVGRAVVPMLLQGGARVRVLRRAVSAVDGVEAVLGDLHDAGALRRLAGGADAVVHLAGVAHTSLPTAEERARAYGVNVEGTQRLMDAAKSAGVRRVVLMSSAHVYAGQCGVALTEDAATASTAKAREGDYAAMKLLAEDAARRVASERCDVAILRPCLVYGRGARANLLSLMKAVRGGYYVHPAGADAVRSFVSVETVAAAVAHVLREDVAGGTYNVADENARSLRAWVDSIADVMGVRRPRAVPVGALRSLAAVGSVAKAVGLPAPLTRDALRKLTADFSLSVSRLRASGFVWRHDGDAVMRAMVEAFLQGRAG